MTRISGSILIQSPESGVYVLIDTSSGGEIAFDLVVAGRLMTALARFGVEPVEADK